MTRASPGAVRWMETCELRWLPLVALRMLAARFDEHVGPILRLSTVCHVTLSIVVNIAALCLSAGGIKGCLSVIFDLCADVM